MEAQCLIEEGYRKAVYGKTVCTVFDEGGLATISMDSLLRHRRSKVAETDRLILTVQLPVLYSTLNSIPKLPEITMQDKQEDK